MEEDPILGAMRLQGLTALVADEERYFCAQQVCDAWPILEGEIPEDVREAFASFVASGVSGWATKNREAAKETSQKTLEAILRHLEGALGQESAIPFLLKVQDELISAGIIKAEVISAVKGEEE